MTQLAFAIDLNRCQDTFGCMGACKQHGQVELGTMLTRTYTVTTGNFDDVQTYFIPIMCQQCRKPACMAACPKNAITKRADGIVIVNSDPCPECPEHPCTEACPYGAISYGDSSHRALKCDLCADLVEEGRIPFCAQMCNSSAFVFGDIDDPESVVSLSLANAGENVHALKPEANTEPSTKYILRDKTWHDMDSLRAR